MNSLIHKSFFSWRTLILSVVVLMTLAVSLVVSASRIDRARADSGGHLITIHDRGTKIVIISSADTIGEALKEAKISLDQKDLVEPNISETIIAPEYQVNIYRARPITIVDGNIRQTIITAFQTPEQIAKEAGISLFSEDKAVTSLTNNITQGFGELLTIQRSIPLEFTIYGKTSAVRTQAKTVGELLSEKGIKMESNDRVEPSLTTPIVSGASVKLWREGKQTVTVEEPVVFAVETIEDANRSLDYHVIQTTGENGLRTVTYEILVVNGQESSRVEIASVVTKQASKQIEVVGVMGKYTTPSENESITWNYLIAQGFSRTQTAGIMGNLMQEHGFRTTDTPGGLGIVQWTGSRRANLMARANWDNIYVQLDFLMSELNSGYSGVKNQILASVTLTEAVQIFQNQYERCGVCMEGNRINYAQNILASH
jgi:resuscitation-promoting factor RpfB